MLTWSPVMALQVTQLTETRWLMSHWGPEIMRIRIHRLVEDFGEQVPEPRIVI